MIPPYVVCQGGAGTEEIGEKPKISVQLVWKRWWSTERTGELDIPPYVVGVREVLVRRKLVKSQNLRTTCFE